MHSEVTAYMTQHYLRGSSENGYNPYQFLQESDLFFQPHFM